MYDALELIDTGIAKMWVRRQGSIGSMDHALVSEQFSGKYAQSVLSLPEGSVVLDAGAHIGSYAFAIWSKRPDLKILCMEPLPYNYGILVKNIITNEAIKTVHPIQFAIGATEGYITMRRTGNEGAWSGVANNAYFDAECPVYVITYDTLLDMVPVDKIDYIKLDIEGMELDVIQSIDLTAIYGLDIELHAIPGKESYHEELLQYLRDSGFTLDFPKPDRVDAHR